MGKVKYFIITLVLLVVVAVPTLFYYLVISDSFNRELNHIVNPYRFDIGKWEVATLSAEWGRFFDEGPAGDVNDTAVVNAYFDNLERIKALEGTIEAIDAGNATGDLAALEDELAALLAENDDMVADVELVLEAQVAEAYAEQGIYNPWDNESQGTFPPMNFTLGKTPRVLVISPRDNIQSMREITLLPEIDEATMESIEEQIAELDVSALVVGIGGMATYPHYVSDRSSLRRVIDIVAEEWLHQYLAFKPLGFLYILDLTGLQRNYDIATMNETLAGIVSGEIGEMVWERYYATDEPVSTSSSSGEEPVFDFNKEMREIRLTVDDLLAQGQIEAAEAFMEEKRQYLAENGYYIRKLNQAYFAFHGTYADSPAFINPIGEDLQQLRAQSGSLKDFLETVAAMTTRQELAESVG